MSLGRLADLLHARGLTWSLRVGSGVTESSVYSDTGTRIYSVSAASIEVAVSRTIAAIGASGGLQVVRLPDAASRKELESIARAAGCGPVSDPHLGPDGRWRGSAVLLKRPTETQPQDETT